jgi:phosphatidylserine decarboxylase
MSERGGTHDRRGGSAVDATVPDVTPEVPAHRWRLLLSMIERLPQAALSRGFGSLASVRIPPSMRPVVLGGFARLVGIDLTEAEKPLESYESINDLFVRRLRAGARSWPSKGRPIASPVDGVLGRSGTIEAGRLLQAKGRWYTAAELLGDEDEASLYEGGIFITIYLSPRHYHRIHSPVAGRISAARHVPGALLPVNAAGVMHVDRLFARNERVVCSLEAEGGRAALVAVAAYNVGGISTAFDATWLTADRRGVTNRGAAAPEVRSYSPPVDVALGDEVMAFHLGSTIVLLLQRGASTDGDLVPGSEVLLGQQLGRWKS